MIEGTNNHMLICSCFVGVTMSNNTKRVYVDSPDARRARTRKAITTLSDKYHTSCPYYKLESPFVSAILLRVFMSLFVSLDGPMGQVLMYPAESIHFIKINVLFPNQEEKRVGSRGRQIEELVEPTETT